MTDEWWRISGPRYTFGLRARDGVVVEVAPIGKWALGKPVGKVLAWYRLRIGTSVERLGKDAYGP